MNLLILPCVLYFLCIVLDLIILTFFTFPLFLKFFLKTRFSNQNFMHISYLQTMLHAPSLRPSVNDLRDIVEDCIHRFTEPPVITCCNKSPTKRTATYCCHLSHYFPQCEAEMAFLHLCAKKKSSSPRNTMPGILLLPPKWNPWLKQTPLMSES